jgi:hypothetical protein
MEAVDWTAVRRKLEAPVPWLVVWRVVLTLLVLQTYRTARRVERLLLA